MDTQLLLDHEPAADGYMVRALLRISGSAPDRTDRQPLDLALVLDRSGSMMGHKLQYARDATIRLVRRLGERDTISVVAYDSDVRTLAARAPGAHKPGVIQALQALDTGGMTNLSGGWLRGRELVAEGPKVPAGGPGAGAAPVRRVILLTDGLANQGITDPGALRDLVATAAANGIGTTTIGFGEDYNERLLRSLAEAGGGSTYYIESPDQAPAVFEAEIAGLMALAAQNVAVTVRPAPAVALAAVHHQYPSQQQADGSLRLELGDLYALEPRSLLCEFLWTPEEGVARDREGLATRVDEREHPEDATVAHLTIEGHVLLTGGGVEKKTVTLPIKITRDEAGVVDPEVRRELLVQQAARAREEALEDRDRGDFGAAARKLRDVAERVQAYGADDPDLRDEAEDLAEMAALFDAEQVTTADAKYMYQRSYSVAQSKRAAMQKLMEDRTAGRKRR